MKYISRRISLIDDKEKEVECSDVEFLGIDAPLIVLGEPGAGKSELLRFASEQLDAKIYNASTVDAGLMFNDRPNAVIIDGVDEVTAYETGTPVNKVLAKLPLATRFILSCRAVDWQDTVNKRIISQKWQQQPIVGRIMPLNEQEIIEFVNANGEGQDEEEFLKESRQRDVLDLLRNPQNLLLLLKAVKNEGWPDTRLKLYETASLELVNEDNDIHGSINKTRPAIEQLIETAGFVFSQLLLSGKAGVQLYGKENEECPKISELASDGISNEIIQSALSTKLFRLIGQNLLEPCHRTVAEFLAAKWLANAMKNQLSARRLENILYGSNHIVPAALRGLHAWIATLNSTVAETFIERDPYGFFRYGDPSVLTITQSQTLLSSLEKVAEIDPYFRSEDWHATFGRGLARKELRDDIIRVIRNPQSPYQLSHLIIKSIQGDDFSNDISSDLLSIVVDRAATPVERDAAVDALCECDSQPDWKSVVEDLRKFGDVESLRIALDLVQDHVELFSGITLAELLVELANAIFADNGPNYYGLGHGLHKKLSTTQLEESLDVLAESTVETATKGRRNRLGDVEVWLYKFVQERFERGTLPSIGKVWSWLQHLAWHSYHGSDWDKYSGEYFSQNIEYRKALQAEALKSADNAKGLWSGLFHLGYISPGLGLREDDLILHLGNLLKDKDSYADWDERWKILVRWGQVTREYTGKVLEFARNQSLQSNILSSHLAELERPPERDYEKEWKQEEHKYKRKENQEAQKRHKEYQKIRNQLPTGKPLRALYEIASSYLGRHSNIKGETGLERIAHLTGVEIVPLALEGITAAATKADIPTPMQIVELHTNEGKHYFIEPVLLVHCAILTNDDKNLAGLPLSLAASALAACRWGVHGVGDDITSDLQEKLEAIVFSDKGNKEAFVRNTMEPYLKNGAEHLSGLYRLVRNEEFSDIAGQLAIEWIEKYTDLSNNSLRELLIAAIRHASMDKVVELIREHVSNKKLKDEEQRNIWIGATFLLDFENNIELLNAYAEENRERLWSLRAMSNPEREKYEGWPKLSSAQHHFLITKFGALWPPANHPTDVWRGDKNPWDASQFIQGRIGDLAADISDQAEVMLKGLINAEGLEGYQNYIKHVYAQQTRRRAEAKRVVLPIEDVKKILLKGEPAKHDDLQALLMDELEALQGHIRNGSTNDIFLYWNGETPHDENYCRDRITSSINPYLERYSVRAHTEGTMPDSNRCDLLNTHGLMNLPIEIKGQWHDQVWTAAGEQLQNYTREYHSDGRGIYLVLWFGYLGANHQKNPHGWQGQQLPKTLDKMRALLAQKCEGISEKTKVMVLDVSKPVID